LPEINPVEFLIKIINNEILMGIPATKAADLIFTKEALI